MLRMNNDSEYKNFLISSFVEYVKPKITKLQNDSYIFQNYPIIRSVIEKPSYPMHKAKETMDIVNYINNYCRTDEEIYNIFREEKLERTMKDASEIVSNTRMFAQESGFIDALDHHFENIIGEIKMDYLPSHDLELIRYLENKDPKVELEGAIYQFKSERSSRSGIFSGLPKPSQILQETENILKEKTEVKSTKHNNKSSNGSIDKLKNRFSRRLCNGLKKIIPGACIFCTDIAVIFAASYIQAHDASSYGSMASSAIGAGKIFEGYRMLSPQQRLRELKKLYDEGLIDREQVDRKQEEILREV
jgi:hypothetical protein